MQDINIFMLTALIDVRSVLYGSSLSDCFSWWFCYNYSYIVRNQSNLFEYEYGYQRSEKEHIAADIFTQSHKALKNIISTLVNKNILLSNFSPNKKWSFANRSTYTYRLKSNWFYYKEIFLTYSCCITKILFSLWSSTESRWTWIKEAVWPSRKWMHRKRTHHCLLWLQCSHKVLQYL